MRTSSSASARHTDLPFAALGIASSSSTAVPSGVQSPVCRPILIQEEQLGTGGFSVVHKAWDVSTGLKYACKTFTKTCDWKHEAEVMRRISHDNIVQFMFSLDGPKPSLVLELAIGGDLHQQNRRQRISQKELAVVFQQCLAGLCYLHQQEPPIAHRDIKPTNILIFTRHPLWVKLGDFGVSKASDDLFTVCGTWTYAAPEILGQLGTEMKPKRRYNVAVDIWSLGVVGLEYSNGLPPETDDHISRCESIVHWAWFPKISKNKLSTLLCCMLVLEPEHRFSAETCLQWTQHLDGNAISNTSLSASADLGAKQKSAVGRVTRRDQRSLGDVEKIQSQEKTIRSHGHHRRHETGESQKRPRSTERTRRNSKRNSRSEAPVDFKSLHSQTNTSRIEQPAASEAGPVIYAMGFTDMGIPELGSMTAYELFGSEVIKSLR
ncbi:hypothetical protein BST61_g2964 [Cercospora zeina]